MIAVGVVAVAPLVLVALPVYSALWALRTRGKAVRMGAVAVATLPAPVALLVAYVARGADPVAVAGGYVDAQLEVAAAVVRGWPVTD